MSVVIAEAKKSNVSVIPVQSRARPSLLIAGALFLLPLIVYVGSIGYWSLDGDEIYTYVDSSKPVTELLDYETKPLYYLICHVLLKLNPTAPLEFLLRLPAAFFAGLTAFTYYWLLWTPRHKTSSLLTAILVLLNPWMLEISQFARFYSLMFLCVSIAAIALFRWLFDRRPRWLVMFGIAGVIATLSHTTAGVVFPAGVLAACAALWREDAQRFNGFLRRYAVLCLLIGMMSIAITAFFLSNTFLFWFHSKQGHFGNYSIPQLIMGLLVFGGLSSWALAVLPLAKAPKRWRPDELFLAIMVAGSVIPFLFLVPLGGGVSSRYLLASLPCMFVLAGRHWELINRNLPAFGYRLGLAGGLLACNVPYLMSILNDGNHHDYRAAAHTLDQLSLDDPIVVATAHGMLQHYLRSDMPVHELGSFENGIPRNRLEPLIEQARAEHRPLYVVSREDRFHLSSDDQQWLGQRFAMIRSIQSQRYDHRRYRMAIYEFRPSNRSGGSMTTRQ